MHLRTRNMLLIVTLSFPLTDAVAAQPADYSPAKRDIPMPATTIPKDIVLDKRRVELAFLYDQNTYDLQGGCFYRLLSTLIPQAGQSTRRIVYTNTTAIPHNGTKSKCRGEGIVSYPGRRFPQPEQMARPLALGLTSTSTVGLAASSRQAILPNTNDL